jgi:NADH:ubiquinone oxidoreductase subunit 6 (subunit J)
MIESAVFTLLATMMVLVPAVLAVSLKNIFHCALWLVVVFDGRRGHVRPAWGRTSFLWRRSLVYAGGITVLLLFVVLLSGSPKDWVIKQVNSQVGLESYFLAGIFVAHCWRRFFVKFPASSGGVGGNRTGD